MSERAEHASFARRSGNRRRSARGTKFHLVPRFLYGVPGTSDFTDDDLNCNFHRIKKLFHLKDIFSWTVSAKDEAVD